MPLSFDISSFVIQTVTYEQPEPTEEIAEPPPRAVYNTRLVLSSDEISFPLLCDLFAAAGATLSNRVIISDHIRYHAIPSMTTAPGDLNLDEDDADDDEPTAPGPSNAQQ